MCILLYSSEIICFLFYIYLFANYYFIIIYYLFLVILEFLLFSWRHYFSKHFSIKLPLVLRRSVDYPILKA